ncbi:MAG: hypothetical protein QME12_03210 [Nanoarchaeota archaeon]|nr:hypothetical protein [Nanoarchaeota archaeon]
MAQSHAATADEMGMGGMGGYSRAQPKKPGFFRTILRNPFKIFDIRAWKPTEEGKEQQKSYALGIVFVFLFALLIIYGFYWASSPGGERTLVQFKNIISPYNPVTWYKTQIGKAQSIGNIWTAEPVAVEKKGILFESFTSMTSEEITQGSIAQFKYGLKLSNVDLPPTPVTMSCKVKGKELEGRVVPNPLIIKGKRLTDSAQCWLSKEITSSLSGTVQVEGGISFPFKTEDVRLKVYFTSRAMEDSLPKEQDFFDYMNIDERQPIRAKYNGEPISIGVGVSVENIQPVLLEEGINPVVGISLRNEWDGDMSNLISLKLTLPKELTINQELSPSPSEVCPFMLSRQGTETIEYKASGQFLEGFRLEPEGSKSFECRLDVSPDFLGRAPYIVKEYRVDAEYEYAMPPAKNKEGKTATITLKKVESATGGPEGGEVVNPLI